MTFSVTYYRTQRRERMLYSQSSLKPVHPIFVQAFLRHTRFLRAIHLCPPNLPMNPIQSMLQPHPSTHHHLLLLLLLQTIRSPKPPFRTQRSYTRPLDRSTPSKRGSISAVPSGNPISTASAKHFPALPHSTKPPSLRGPTRSRGSSAITHRMHGMSDARLYEDYALLTNACSISPYAAIILSEERSGTIRRNASQLFNMKDFYCFPVSTF